MWLKSKPKNRRLKREHLLEVKASSQQRRNARWRVATMVASVSIGMLGFVAVFWLGGAWLVNRLVYHNEAFSITRIDIETDGVIPIEQIRKWAGVKKNDNLMALDLPNIKRNLELVPLIREAAVERILPRTLKLRVMERVPIAQVHALEPRLDGEGDDVVIYYLDEKGYVMMRPDKWFPGAKAWRSVDALPVICGIDASELHPGWAVGSPRIRFALELLQAFEDSPMYPYVYLVRIDVYAPQVIKVITHQGSEVTLMPDKWDKQFFRWRLIHDKGAEQGNTIATLDLSVSNNLPVRWVEASSVPPVNSKPPRINRVKRKNV
ncbi:MAG TPA: FtsQ-type POTRA domain-containing protein [Candidatus Paceibacterota bacterium]|nr:FtsQ-type POTRA domain-containing protein [Verrucomicrobiota bacterium]HRY48456.1 FtsQ-type POTRA domain-containing protein [Candidatus Paceibacterota bacterium]HSA00955.1 FtsQ-type POTRA domain-containing protein [Candidatus Paceibacterota bacterium]